MTRSNEKRRKPASDPHKPETLRAMLAVGCHRLDLGRAREVAALIQTHPGKTRQLVECLFDSDPGIANRAADALERASYHQPSLLAPWKDLVLGLLPDAKQNKLRWNLALVLPRMQLTKPVRSRARPPSSKLISTTQARSSRLLPCTALPALRNRTQH